MINLLPLEIKKTLRTDYWRRIFIVVFFSLTCALATLLLLLGLIYFRLSQNTDARSTEVKGGEIATKEQLEKELKKSNGELSFFSLKDSGYFPTFLFNELTASDGTYFGINLTEFSYKENKNGPMVILSGKAKTREALISFLDHLRSKKIVVSVDSPLASLSKSVDIPFSATVNLIPYGGT